MSYHHRKNSQEGAAGSVSSPTEDKPADDKKERGASSAHRARPRDLDAPVDLSKNEVPLPYDESPPLPDEAPPRLDTQAPETFLGKDGWVWEYDETIKIGYFVNTITYARQWWNPDDTAQPWGSTDRYQAIVDYEARNAAPTPAPAAAPIKPKRVAGGYNPAIHGNYDPNASYAIEARKEQEEEEAAAAAAIAANAAAMTAAAAAAMASNSHDNSYTATGTFNRFTGNYQPANLNPENHNDEAKSYRQANAFFDVDKAANSHDGRSLKAERRNQQLSKSELKKFVKKRKEKKEEKRRAWLRD